MLARTTCDPLLLFLLTWPRLKESGVPPSLPPFPPTLPPSLPLMLARPFSDCVEGECNGKSTPAPDADTSLHPQPPHPSFPNPLPSSPSASCLSQFAPASSLGSWLPITPRPVRVRVSAKNGFMLRHHDQPGVVIAGDSSWGEGKGGTRTSQPERREGREGGPAWQDALAVAAGRRVTVA